MKLSLKNVKIITNSILVVIVVAVTLIGFLPTSAVTISGSEDYSAIYNGKRDGNGVAIMFNVYENTETVQKILDVLKENSAKATFFVGGCWADDNADTLKRIINEGHELGNHGYYHKDHKKLDESGNISEITNNDKIVSALTGYKMTLFAPPSGSFNKTTLTVAKSLGYSTVMWSKDTIDWRDSDLNVIVKRATNGIIAGDMILMHPKQHTLNALPEILKNIKKAKLTTQTVSECVGLKTQA